MEKKIHHLVKEYKSQTLIIKPAALIIWTDQILKLVTAALTSITLQSMHSVSLITTGYLICLQKLSADDNSYR